MRTCIIPGCNGKYKGLGYCIKHYQKFRKYGDPLYKKNNMFNLDENGNYYTVVICPDCKQERIISHKNYYKSKKDLFICSKCSAIKNGLKRRKNKLKITIHDYVKIYFPEHPMSDLRGEVYLHRLIISNKLKRLLKSDEYVHHIDENKENNNINNLKLVSPKEHNTIHIVWNKGLTKMTDIRVRKYCETRRKNHALSELTQCKDFKSSEL